MGVVQIDQQLRALSGFPEDLGSIFNTYLGQLIITYNSCSDVLFLTLNTEGTHTYTPTYTHTYEIIKSLINEK